MDTNNNSNVEKLQILNERLERIEKLLESQSINSKIIYSIEEVAEYIGVSKGYVYKMTSRGLIPYYKPNGKTLYFKKEEIDDWLLRNRQSTNAEIETEAINYNTNKLKK